MVTAQLVAFLTIGAARVAADPLHATPQLRRPAAMAVHGDRLYVANQRSGTISLIDLATRQVVGEHLVGKRLEDLALSPDGKWLFAADSAQNRLVVLAARGDQLEVRQTLPVIGAPVNVRVSTDGSFCSVASLWARRVTLINLIPSAGTAETSGGAELRVRSEINLPFAPRLQWLSRDGSRLVVADAFGGNLASIDTRSSRIVAVRSLEGHNLRGLAADADEHQLLVAHQILNGAVPTTHDRVFWGTLMGNVVRSIPLDDLFVEPNKENGASNLESQGLARWSLYPLGRPGAATGDPGAIAVSRNGKTLVALSGVDEVAMRSAPLKPFFQHPVGRRPTAIALDAEERLALVSNMFDDSITVLDLETSQVQATIFLGPRPPLTDADRGEIAFYDAKYSLDGWYSCHSCHPDGHSNGLLNDNFSDDAFGSPKRVLSLLGVGETAPWAWSGGEDSLAGQVHKSITITMRDYEAMHATEDNVAALVAYLRTLSPPPSIAAAREEIDEAAVARGKRLFSSQGCAECHQPPTYTSAGAYDVGLRDAAGRREFNPPSLLGVSQRDALFHDNRAASLDEVLFVHRHGGADQLPPADRDALLAFLRSL